MIEFRIKTADLAGVINNDESPRMYDDKIAGIPFACLCAYLRFSASQAKNDQVIHIHAVTNSAMRKQTGVNTSITNPVGLITPLS